MLFDCFLKNFVFAVKRSLWNVANQWFFVSTRHRSVPFSVPVCPQERTEERNGAILKNTDRNYGSHFMWIILFLLVLNTDINGCAFDGSKKYKKSIKKFCFFFSNKFFWSFSYNIGKYSTNIQIVNWPRVRSSFSFLLFTNS